MIIDVDVYLAHYGTPRRSGRYPWGSGGDETTGQKNKSFLDYVADLKRQGLTEAEIAKGVGLESTTQLRAAKTIAKNAVKASDIAQAQRLKDQGLSNVAIAQRMQRNESSVRALLAPAEKDKVDVLGATSNMLKQQVDEKKYVDIGAGVELYPQIGVSRTKFNTAVALLEEEGYKKYYVKVEQLGTGKETTIKVLTPPGTTYSELFKNRTEIKQISEYTEDHGRTYLGLKPPTSINSKRVAIRYKEDGGDKADGVIYVRPGVEDISMGKSRYAQVRIAVDGTHYIKGMAMYKADLPDGVDLMFNTNKSNTGNKKDALKELKRDKDGNIDADNPFGAVISRQQGHMNIVNEEGDWSKWSRSLSSQMLSKQSPSLAKNQLDITHESKKAELEEIMALTNPAVRKKLLMAYAEDADSASVHLKAAALRNQASHVILPVASMRETEIYAPNYDNGTRVALIRYPHGGKFEIPELVVNNRQPEAKSLLGRAQDAVGINAKVAERLSGADFDGDTVLVIPNDHGKVKTQPALAGLKDFDPQRAYPPYDGMPTMNGGRWNATTKKAEFAPGARPSGKNKQVEMGKVSNLITDMTIKGANPAELARAVRHSMVVIDAEKHNLNYRESARVNNIKQLKEKYQLNPDTGKPGGASTLISRATSETKVPDRVARRAAEGGPIDKSTGKLVYTPTGKSYVNSKGETVLSTFKSQRLAETDDAHTLSSGTPIEKIYADHSNRLKNLANQARKSAVNTKNAPTSRSATIAYANEVATLNSKLALALRNAPRERQAQVIANAIVSAKKQANPGMDPVDLKKIKSQALNEARTRTGAKKDQIQITPAEWDAIQAGAISNHKLTDILTHADIEVVKMLATPKSALLLNPSKKRLAQTLLANGYTQAEVAKRLGMSVSTLKKGLSDG